MWVLVVVLMFNDDYLVRTDDFLYQSYEHCQSEANVSYNLYMATRPDKDAQAIVFCTELPKGV